MLEKLDVAVFSNDDITFANNIDSNNVILFSHDICEVYEKNISEELIPAAWHPTRWLVWYMSRNEKQNKRNRIISDWWKEVWS